VASLNPALDDVRFCPRCSSPVTVDHPRSMMCTSCDYVAFFNPKPVAAVIPVDADGNILLHRRGYEPGRGLWTFPGGFVDLGESVEDAARREVLEEFLIDVELGPLVGVYTRAEDRVMLVVFRGTPKGTPQPTDEAPEIRAFAPDALPWDEMAFWSTPLALRAALER
jgi:8-oxo-dGTP diphosphatase